MFNKSTGANIKNTFRHYNTVQHNICNHVAFAKQCPHHAMKGSKDTTANVRDKRRKIDSVLLSTPGCTRKALVDILSKLKSAGSLNESAFEPISENRFRTAASFHATRPTPYGETLRYLEISNSYRWPHLNPFAQLFYLSTISDALSCILKQVLSRNNMVLTVVLYIDECQPGNPLRPDLARKIQCVYWNFIEFPQYLLQRAETWFLLGACRSSVVNDMPGEVSGFMKHILHLFFSQKTVSFATGVSFAHRGEQIMFTAKFGGFLSDEKAHKEIFNIKGAGGNKPCPTCKNIVGRHISTKASNYLENLSCCDYELFDYWTDEDYWTIVDKLRASSKTLSKTKLKDLEMALGVNYCEQSLLFDDTLRPTVKVVSQCIRDWMHTMVSGGVASSELSLVVQIIQESGFELNDIAKYCSKFVLQKSRGKVSATWWDSSRLNYEQMRVASASEALTMISLLQAFATDVLRPLGILQKHIECLDLLSQLLDRLKQGPDDAMQHVEEIRQLIVSHNKLFTQLYAEHVKPKFHQMFHIPDNMVCTGKLLSCWVTERKHRAVKAVGLYAFKDIELSVARDMLTTTSTIYEKEDLFRDAYLKQPKRLTIGTAHIEFSNQAILPMGEFSRSDVVYFFIGNIMFVGEVAHFFAYDNELIAEISVYDNTSEARVYSMASPVSQFVDCRSIRAATAWAKCSDNALRVILPHFARST